MEIENEVTFLIFSDTRVLHSISTRLHHQWALVQEAFYI